MELFWDEIKIWFAFWTNTTKWFVTVCRHGCWCQCWGESQGEPCCGWVVLGCFMAIFWNILGTRQTIEKTIMWWFAAKKTRMSVVSHYLEGPLPNFSLSGMFPTAMTVSFQSLGVGMVCPFFIQSANRNATLEPWNPGTLETLETWNSGTCCLLLGCKNWLHFFPKSSFAVLGCLGDSGAKVHEATNRSFLGMMFFFPEWNMIDF